MRWLELRRGHRSAASILNEFGVVSPPVPIHGIIQAMGIPVYAVSEPGWSGALEVVEEPPKVNIWIRAEDVPLRQRFTLSHELGHLLLRHPGSIFRDTNFLGSREEAAANGYAANLLMPLPWVQIYLAAYGWDIDATARLFQVSSEAMRIRSGKLMGMS